MKLKLYPSINSELAVNMGFESAELVFIVELHSVSVCDHIFMMLFYLLTRVTIIIFFLDGSAGIPKRACMNLTKLEFVGQRKKSISNHFCQMTFTS